MTTDQAAPAAFTSSRVMLDSSRPALIPAKAPMVAGYVDGSYQWQPADWQRFPSSTETVRITVEPFGPGFVPTGFPFGDWQRASVIDVETGAFSPAAAARFVVARNGFRPGTASVYCNKDTLPSVLRACRGQAYYLWLAWYIGRVPTPADVAPVVQQITPFGVTLAAWQWTSGPRYDTSAVLDADWHPDTS